MIRFPARARKALLPISGKTFYAIAPEHGKMPSADGIRQKIVNIISGSNLNEGAAIFGKSQIDQNSSLCKLRGMLLFILSPVDINVTDQDGNVILGVDADGNTHYEIPGASFDEVGGHKYLFLPSDFNGQYAVNLKGTDNKTFTLIEKKINGDQIISTTVFNDVSVKTTTTGNLVLSDAQPAINLTTNGISSVVLPTATIDSGASDDVVPPQTTVLINGAAPRSAYNVDAVITMSTRDYAQNGDPAGIFSLKYILDGKSYSTSNSTSTIAVSAEGNHALSYYSEDKLGNKEQEKSISFAIDKTAPELQFNFDQTAKDLAISATDNLSDPKNIVITDNGGAVTAADQTGNAVKLSFVEKNRKQSLRAQINGLSYNNVTANMSGVQLAYAWFYGYTPKVPSVLVDLQSLPAMPAALPKTGSLSFLLQQAKLKDGSFVVALYGSGKTLILEYKNKKLNLKTIIGLKIINFATNRGVFSWSY